MKKYASMLLGIVCLLVAMPYALSREAVIPVPDQSKFSHTTTVKPFQAIHVDGRVNVTVKYTSSVSKPKVAVTRFGSQMVNVAVKEKTLTVSTPWRLTEGFTYVPTVTVYVNTLNNLTLTGPANMTVLSAKSRAMSIEAHGSGKLMVKARVHVVDIEKSGTNTIKIASTSAQRLVVHGKGSGQISITGSVQQLYARLNDSVSLQAKGLDANDIWITTYSKANASIHPVKVLRAYAKQHSNIYYYKYMNELTRVTEQSGNVLQMKW